MSGNGKGNNGNGKGNGGSPPGLSKTPPGQAKKETGGASSSASADICDWAGHCLGASCGSHNDCFDVLECQVGICSSPGRLLPGCSWAGHCQGASCSADSECDRNLTCGAGGRCKQGPVSRGGAKKPKPIRNGRGGARDGTRKGGNNTENGGGENQVVAAPSSNTNTNNNNNNNSNNNSNSNPNSNNKTPTPANDASSSNSNSNQSGSEGGGDSPATDPAQTSNSDDATTTNSTDRSGTSKAAADLEGSDSASIIPASTFSTVVGDKTVVSVVPEQTIIPTVFVDGGSGGGGGGGSSAAQLPTGAIIGISVGAGVFALLILLAMFCFVRHMRRATQQQQRGTQLYAGVDGTRPSSFSSSTTRRSSSATTPAGMKLHHQMAPVEIDHYGGKDFRFEVSGESQPMGELPTEAPRPRLPTAAAAAAVCPPPKAVTSSGARQSWRISNVAELPCFNYDRMPFGTVYDDASVAGLKAGEETATMAKTPPRQAGTTPDSDRNRLSGRQLSPRQSQESETLGHFSPGQNYRQRPASSATASVAGSELVLSPMTSHGVADHDIPLSPVTTISPNTPIVDHFKRRPTLPDLAAEVDERPRATFGVR